MLFLCLLGLLVEISDYCPWRDKHRLLSLSRKSPCECLLCVVLEYWKECDDIDPCGHEGTWS